MPDPQHAERFLPVRDFPGYEVSEWGRVRSWLLPGAPNLRGRVGPSARILKRQRGPGGYLTVGLSRDGQRTTRYVHELVLEAFAGPRPLGMEARHLDGDKANAAAWNLAWGTKRENEEDKVGHGTRLTGERHALRKLSADDVRGMFRLRQDGWTFKRLSARFGVSKSQAHRVCHGHNWRHLADASQAA